MTGSSATLTGTVNPNRRATSVHFEYGTTSTYGAVTPDVGAGSGAGGVALSAGVQGLAPGTTYHYRIVATSQAGTTRGNDMTLTTPAPGGGGGTGPGGGQSGSPGGGTPTTTATPTTTTTTGTTTSTPATRAVTLKLRGTTLTLKVGGAFAKAAVTIRRGSRTVARGGGALRGGKLSVRLAHGLKRGRYAITIVLADAKGAKTTITRTLKV